MFDFEDCGKNCFNCENGKTKKDRDNCMFYRQRRNYWRRQVYKAKKQRLTDGETTASTQ